ncbi:hypothetical protein JCM10908_002329 [Rhodotorula pacifica]|uniref:C2H2-type zinc finger protein n=1 Tax=Rhodotorula pacifica TaxID=1495444 RepID=UPI003176CDB2
MGPLWESPAIGPSGAGVPFPPHDGMAESFHPQHTLHSHILTARRSTPDLRYPPEGFQPRHEAPATFSRPARLPTHPSDGGLCSEIGHRGLMMFGLDDTGVALSTSPYLRETAHPVRSDRLGRPKSYPSLLSPSQLSMEWHKEPVETDYYQRSLTDNLYGPTGVAGPPTPQQSPRPLAYVPHPADHPPQADYDSWGTDELPCPPQSQPTAYYELPPPRPPPRPIHSRSLSLDPSVASAPMPSSRRLPPLLTSSTSLHEIPSVLRHRPLSCATSENVSPVFTLPAPVNRSSSSCSSQWTPHNRSEEGYWTSQEWITRPPLLDSPLEMPVSAPVDSGRFQPYPTHHRSNSQNSSSVYDGAQPDRSPRRSQLSSTASLPLVTPPTSPSRQPSSMSSSASDVGLQMSPIHPRHRKTPRAAMSEADEAAAAKKKPHKCLHPDCDRAFKRLEHLRRHERVHTQERPFQCQEYGCGMRFSRHDNLLQHQKTHFKNGKTRRAVAARLAQAEAARAAAFGFTHTFVPSYR